MCSHSTQHLSALVLATQRDVDRLEKDHKDQMTEGSPSYEKRLRMLGLLSLENKRLTGDFMTMFQHLESGYMEDGDSIFSRSHMEKSRHKMIFFFCNENNQPLKSLRRSGGFPMLDTFKIQLCRVLV